MSLQRYFQRTRVLFYGLVATSTLVTAGPCDIYLAGNTPCVAAHSTTRALYNAYDGPLYQVKRPDGHLLNISPLTPGGVANSAAQDTFCGTSTCVITQIFDQSGNGNDLPQAQHGRWLGPGPGGIDNMAPADAAPVMLNGNKVYGVFVAPGTGYRNNNAIRTATGGGAEGMYAVVDGTHFNSGCCFDYGNAERSGRDTANGHMEAVYFGSCTQWGRGSGTGPWIMADLENGLFSGEAVKLNAGNPSIHFRFVTAMVKGQPGHWAIRGGNSAMGNLSTYYNGVRPAAPGYNHMSLEGSIVLGIGGDNSNKAEGTFYEGVMTSGYPSDLTENKVQADIVAAGYAAA